jgi:hypothetical protein
MARARAAEHPKTRSKAVLIEEISRGIGKFQEVLAAIDDFSQEGFPYRDAARAKAELQLRECVRRIFGERSPEFQTYRNHKLHTSNKAETAQSIAVIKGLIQTLEDRKLELQGLKPPPAADQPAETSPAAPPQMTLVPPTAQITMAAQPAITAPPMTLSVALTTNLGTPVTPLPAAPQSPVPIPEPHPQVASPIPTAPSPSVVAPAAPVAAGPAPTTQPTPVSPVPASSQKTAQDTIHTAPPIPAEADGLNTRMQQASATPPPPVAAPARTDFNRLPAAPRSAHPTPQAEATPPAAVAPPQPCAEPEKSSAAQTMDDPRSTPFTTQQEALALLRKVCLRFHAVARQLRLRKDYRATLEVEDDYDLQDLLCALLKVEFEEVGTDEWTPPYTGGAPRTTLFLNRDQIAVVAKKTRSGLTTKELADQIAADAAFYTTRDKCTTLFCFIYDPEGRIGSPKRLETDMTSAGDRYAIEVLVAPK